ncbi:hypothetical protein AB0K16_22275 [Nonomuraea jabiensis]|uniref:hypothetical protein n=1 Tax=Nonomuraea jabiensis TaxID=882448 RepID=UPI0034279F6E
MNWIVAMVVDSVIRDENLDAPIPAGVKLYDAFAQSYRVVLINDTSVHPVWFPMNGFINHQAIIERRPEDPGDPAIRRIRQIERMRATGLAPDLLIEPDPMVVAAVIHTGVPTLHYVDPPYVRPEFHPDYQETIVPWEKMVTEIDNVRALRAADKRHLEEE